MNILYLSSSPTMLITNTGRGYSTHIGEMIHAFEKIGHTVLPLVGTTGTIKSQNTGMKTRDWARAHLPVRIIEGASVLYHAMYDMKYFHFARRQCCTFPPDFIYERYIPFHRSGIRLKRQLGIPLLLEVNAPLSERDVHYGKQRRRLAPFVEKRILRAADGIIAVSGKLKEILIDSGIDESKIIVIPNAADPKSFHPDINRVPVRRKYGIEQNIVVGFVGAFCRWHGVEALMAAVEKCIARVPRIHFLLVGDGPMLQFAKQFVQTRALSPFVTFTGRLANQNVPKHIAAMDITIMPDSNDYGSPIKIFEYMATGRPVIAPQVPPVEEVITHDSEGLIVKPGDATQITDAIVALVNNPERAGQMGLAGRQKVLDNYTWTKNAERVLNFLSSLD